MNNSELNTLPEVSLQRSTFAQRATSETTESQRALIWSIGGSDCSAGAGIQADIKTAGSFQVAIHTLLTGVTAQNSTRVYRVEPVSMELFAEQWQSLSEETCPDVIKVGMLANRQQVQYLAGQVQVLRQRQPVKLILDPVLNASVGQALGDSSVLPAIVQHLLPLVDLLTPNLIELEKIAQYLCPQASSVQQQVNGILNTGCGSVLVKGGHGHDPDQSEDRYYALNYEFGLCSPRIQALNDHGTGCVLSTAITCVLALDYTIEDSLILAKAYVNQSLKGASQSGGLFHGDWPEDHRNFPEVRQKGGTFPQSLTFAPCPRYLGVYPVVDSLAWLERLLNAGVKTLQLRVKNQTDEGMDQLVAQAVIMGRDHQARVFINDYWQLALKHQAYGVHLGQEDLQQADLEKISQAGLRLGVSTHGYFELQTIRHLRPSYIALGHIFPTQTKQMPSRPQGLKNLAAYVSLCEDIPTVAIGGIDLQRAREVAKTGVGSIAVVSAITKALNWQHNLMILSDICDDMAPQKQVEFYD